MTRPPPAEPGRSRGALWLRFGLLFLALSLALVPQNRLWAPLWTYLLGAPVVFAFLWGRQHREFLLWCAYVIAFVAFFQFRMIADDIGPSAKVQYVIEADRVLGLGRVPTVALQEEFYRLGSPRWWDYTALAVHLSYYFAVPVVGLAVWYFRRQYLAPYLLSISLTYAAGAVVHLAVPTVPPWMASAQGHLPPVYRLLFDLWHHVSPEVYRYGQGVAGGNDVAAMPSIHGAAAAIIALVGWRHGGLPRWVGAAYLVLMSLSLVYMGEHYLIDVVAGALMVWVCWRLTNHALDTSGTPGGKG